MKIFISYPDVDKLVCCKTEDRRNVIEASISSREITKNMKRVRSSNVWAYGVNPNGQDDRICDVVAQFKNNHGGPGDIYMYFDVPVKIFRNWVGAHSKGKYFWKYIRNNFKYRKLTGSKRGVLPNAVN